MAEITLTIDGKEVKGEKGDTILQVCQKNSIDVPTLCHFEGLTDIGSCRMCIAEIEEPGRPRIDTACTTPAADGMVVKVNTEKLNEMRKAILELLFSEGNHYCLYCVASGDCELQDLGYRFGVDYIRWPLLYPERHIDPSHKYLIMDPDRCILCRRCVRACAELVGNHTLGVSGRSFEAEIIKDIDLPWGESSCVNAGACLQVCPTGAIADRRSAYLGRPTQVERVESTCTFCSVGCGIEIVTRSNYVLRIEGDWDAEPNKGVLCVAGRFEPLYEEKRKRVLKPLVRRNDSLEEASWDEALDLIADSFQGLDKKSLGAFASTRATNETLQLFAKLMQGLGVANLGCLEGPIAEPPEREVNLADLDEADMFIVVGEDLTKDHQVAGFFVKRGVANRGARLVVVDEKETGLVPFASRWLKPEEFEEAIRLCEAAAQPAVIYGARAGKELNELRRELSDKAKFFRMAPGTNSRGCLAAELGGSFGIKAVKWIYILACDDGRIDEELLAQLKGVDFVAVQSSYLEPWEQVADVILPSPIWAEREGSITNLEGRVKRLAKAIEPPPGVKDDGEIIRAMAAKVMELLSTYDITRIVQEVVARLEEQPQPLGPSAKPGTVKLVRMPKDKELPSYDLGGLIPSEIQFRLEDVITSAEGSSMRAGFMSWTKGGFPWTLNHDEVNYVVEGVMEVTGEGQTVTAYPGDLVLIPKGSSVTFSTPFWVKVYYVTFPAEGKEQ